MYLSSPSVPAFAHTLARMAFGRAELSPEFEQTCIWRTRVTSKKKVMNEMGFLKCLWKLGLETSSLSLSPSLPPSLWGNSDEVMLNSALYSQLKWLKVAIRSVLLCPVPGNAFIGGGISSSASSGCKILME